MEPMDFDAEHDTTAETTLRGPRKAGFAWPTCGGLHRWGDVHLFRDWRIQQHAVCRDQYRLLDRHNLRHAAGSEAACRARLDEIRTERGLEPWNGEAVLVLHGLMRTRYSMVMVAKHLARAGYDVYNVTYPTTRQSIPAHGDNLVRVLAGLPTARRIHLVGYSLGGLVIRSALTKFHDPRLGRVVMMGTPNLGAEKADRWATWPLFDWVVGETGWQLGTSERGISKQLPPTLPVEFGIIAGGRQSERGYYPFLPGDNDFTVTVASTRLPGARDFALVRCAHAFLPYHRAVLEYTSSFLAKGYFRTAEEREPIEVAMGQPA